MPTSNGSSEQDKKSVIITKRNPPIAKLIPFETPKKESIFGCMKDTREIKGDLTKLNREELDVFGEND